MRMRETAAVIGSIALWMLAAAPPGGRLVSEWIGTLLFHLTAALLITWLFVRKQDPRPSLWSPWLFMIAAGIALLGRFGQGV